jgi:hypothetical protein
MDSIWSGSFFDIVAINAFSSVPKPFMALRMASTSLVTSMLAVR